MLECLEAKVSRASGTGLNQDVALDSLQNIVSSIPTTVLCGWHSHSYFIGQGRWKWAPAAHYCQPTDNKAGIQAQPPASLPPYPSVSPWGLEPSAFTWLQQENDFRKKKKNTTLSSRENLLCSLLAPLDWSFPCKYSSLLPFKDSQLQRGCIL